MKTIRELFAKPIDRTIEEVIKVEQADENAVLNELQEYIPTDYLREQFARVYDEIASGPSAPREGIGIWVSGFFGSGKSLFAKILGYTVAAKKLGTKTASEVFKATIEDPHVSALLDSITTRIPFRAVIFDVSMDRGVRMANERLTEIIYKALLREFEYAEDFDLAELEFALEGDEKLDKFRERFEQLHGEPWETRRMLGLALNEASAVLHDLNPKTYPTADSYATGVGRGRADIDPNKLAKRAFEIADRRAPKHALIFIIDEVGQYVSRSVDKMLDLQAVVQAFGIESKNRVERKQAISPHWIVVTSQEKLDEIVHALDSKKIELARLQDRFRLTIDMKQSDIAEITARRVLDKKPAATKLLTDRYKENDGRLKQFATLERTSRDTSITQNTFIKLYPYVPYQVDLCVDIVAGLRLRRGAHRHIGGSNRTIIKQSQELMINPRTHLADAPIGDLVTLDKVYELLYLGNLLPSEISREIDSVAKNLPKNEMAIKVVKAITLLEPLTNLPRTAHNLSVVLYPSITSGSILSEVEKAIQDLITAQVIRDSEDGYKLLTVEEKRWDDRRNQLDPRQADRNRIRREVLKEIFSDPKLRSYRYQDLRVFRNTLVVDGEVVESDGEIPLNVLIAESTDARSERLSEARDESNNRRNEVFWVIMESDEIHALVTEVFRSREMVSEYDRLGAQQRLTGEESSCLAEEKNRRDSRFRKLRTKMLEAVQAGAGFFQGVEHDATALGSNFVAIFHELFDLVVPALYPRVEIGVLALGASDVEKLLTSVNLSGLPQVFHDNTPGRTLIVKQNGKFVPNLGSDLCREIFDHLKREHSYGNKVTGKSLENCFSGIGYGWERESIRLGVAILFRGGAVEVTHQGRKYRNYSDPASRPPFINNPSFRAASFAPRETLDLKVLAKAAQTYEEITGKDVNIDENDIAHAFHQVASADREKLLPVVSRLAALRVPGADAVAAHLEWIEGILEMPPDDCVKTLAGEGKSFLEGRKAAAKLQALATDENLQALSKAQRVLNEQWPILSARSADAELEKAAELLNNSLHAENALEQLEKIRQSTETIASEYAVIYRSTFDNRKKAYRTAVQTIKGTPEYGEYRALGEERRKEYDAKVKEGTDPDELIELRNQADLVDAQLESLLQPLTSRIGAELALSFGETICGVNRATIYQMESDIAAAESFTRDVIRKLQRLVEPEEKLERFRVAQYFSGRISNEQELEEALILLREKLQKILAQGYKIILE